PISPATVRRVSIPFNVPGATGTNGGTQAGDLRPFAVRAYQGKLYVGMVNSAESTQNQADLRAYVYEVTDNGVSLTFGPAPVFQMALNYPRGQVVDVPEFAATGPAAWLPWRTTYGTVSTVDSFVIYPQPLLTGIAFDADGNLFL